MIIRALSTKVASLVGKESIFALSSAPGKAGVAVIRVSGDSSGNAINLLTKRQLLPQPRYAKLASLYHPRTNDLLDKGMVLYFPSPNSFTGENCAEFQVHGGRAVVMSILDALNSIPNLRPAEAGEFVKRAYLNGKLDLTEVEGLQDLLDAETDIQRKLAIAQLGGNLSKLYEGWRKELLHCLAHIEAVIDFADDEDDVDNNLMDVVTRRVRVLIQSIKSHLHDHNKGEILRNGIHIALIGPPNVGKSTLINSLAKRDVAIVSPLAGTTRDVVEVSLNLNGYSVCLSDTAGLRETVDEIEKIGVKKAQERAAKADLTVAIFDATKSFDPSLISPMVLDSIKHDKCMILINKIDVNSQIQISDHFVGKKVMYVSCHTGEGLDDFIQELNNQVKQRFEISSSLNSEPLISRARHRHNLEQCLLSLERYIITSSSLDVDLAAEDLRQSALSLGRITGRVDVEELLDVIFRDFCIGK